MQEDPLALGEGCPGWANVLEQERSASTKNNKIVVGGKDREWL